MPLGILPPLKAGDMGHERRLALRRTSLLAALLGSAILGAIICYLVRQTLGAFRLYARKAFGTGKFPRAC